MIRVRREGPMVIGRLDSPVLFTILDHYVFEGADYFKSTRTLDGLKSIGVTEIREVI